MYNKENVVIIYGQELVTEFNKVVNHAHPIQDSGGHSYSDLLIRAYPEEYNTKLIQFRDRML